jgi:uncharacterized protein YigE (DUF2233 family)
MKRVIALLPLFLLVLQAGAFSQDKTPLPSIPWNTPAPGLSFYRWEVRNRETLLDTLVILRLQPELWAFRVFFNREPKTMKEWQQTTGAPILCNGGFYQENFLPAGRILVNGTSIGPFNNKAMKGMLLSEPKKGFEALPKATLIDLKDPQSEQLIASYEQGIQSFPILLDSKGRVRVDESSFQANRTILARDRQGILYLIITEKPYFTLYRLGHYLKELPLGLELVLNLDGGTRTQLHIQVKQFKYLFEGQGNSLEPARLFSPDRAVKLPTVLGIFPRSSP